MNCENKEWDNSSCKRVIDKHAFRVDASYLMYLSSVGTRTSACCGTSSEGHLLVLECEDRTIYIMRKAVDRLHHLHRQLTQRRGFVSKMADLNINSKYKMLSGHEIPILGYGVCKTVLQYINVSANANNNIYTRGMLRFFRHEDKPNADNVIDRFIKRDISAFLIRLILIVRNQAC